MKIGLDLKVCPWCGEPTYEGPTGTGERLIFECRNVDCPVQPSIVVKDREHGKALWNTRVGE